MPGEGQPTEFYDEVPQAEIGAVGDGSGHETEFIDLSEPTPDVMAAYQSTVERAGFPPADGVMVGENYVRPSTAGRSPDHIDLPLGEPAPVNTDVYNRMVERAGFPPASPGEPQAQEDVDIAL